MVTNVGVAGHYRTIVSAFVSSLPIIPLGLFDQVSTLIIVNNIGIPLVTIGVIGVNKLSSIQLITMNVHIGPHAPGPHLSIAPYTRISSGVGTQRGY